MKKMKNIHMDGRESNGDMNLKRDRWFAEVNRRFKLQVLHYMRRHWSGLDEETRKDIFNMALERLFDRLSQGAVDPGMAWVPGYLKKTVYNLCQSEYRTIISMKARFGQRVPFEETEEQSIGGGDIAALDLYFEEENEQEQEQEQARMWELRREALKYGLSGLTEKQRGLIQMRHIERKRMKEIAEVLGYASPNSAKVAKCKALKKLIEFLAPSLAA